MTQNLQARPPLPIEIIESRQTAHFVELKYPGGKRDLFGPLLNERECHLIAAKMAEFIEELAGHRENEQQKGVQVNTKNDLKIMTPEEFNKWVEHAKPGEQVIYFKGDLALAREHRPDLSDLADAVMQAVDNAFVVAFQKRWYEGVTRYVAERR